MDSSPALEMDPIGISETEEEKGLREEGGYQGEHEWGPILNATGHIWLWPVLVVAIWSLIPLSLTPKGEMIRHQQFWVFACVHHPLYIVGSMLAGYTLFACVLPRPPTGQMVYMLMVSYVLDVGLLYAIREISTQYYRFTSATTVYMISLLLFVHQLIVVHAAMKERERTLKNPGLLSLDDGGVPLSPEIRSGSSSSSSGSSSGSGSSSSVVDDGGARRATYQDSASTYYSYEDSYVSDYYDSDISEGMNRKTSKLGYQTHSWHQRSSNASGAVQAGMLGAERKNDDDDDDDGKKQDTRNLYWVYFKLILFSVCILISYYYCQLFSQLFNVYSNGNNNFLFQIGMIAGFGIPLFIVQSILLVLCKGTQALDGGSLIPLAYFAIEMFYQTFYKHLFTEVRDLPPFIAIQVMILCQGILLYPIRMSNIVHRILYKISTKDSERVLTQQDYLQDRWKYRKALSEEFYYVSMAQRISVVMFLFNALIMRYTYNSPFYPFEEVPGSQYWRILRFCGYMFAFEWASSTVIHLIILRLFKMDTIVMGASQMVEGKATVACVVMAIHILSDANLMLNSFEFG